MELIIDRRARERFADLRVFFFSARGLAAALPRTDPAQWLADAGTALRARLPDAETLLREPAVAAWREAYRRQGLKASEHRCSVEALARRVLAGKAVATGVAAVDLYNAVSLQHLACLGGYDLRRLGPDAIVLRPAAPGDRFEPLGSRADAFPLRDGVLVYAQGSQVLCWALNCRDGQASALAADTDEALFVAESVNTLQAQAAMQALAALREVLASAGAGVSGLGEVATDV